MSKQFAVAKFGSELVAGDNGIRQDALDQYAAGLVESYADDELIVVTSGAVLTGRSIVEATGRDVAMFDDVTLAQIGVNQVMTGWCDAFRRSGVLAGGLLVTHNELQDVSEGAFFRRALDLAGGRGVVSVVNANDALSDDEILKDNDGLASHIARAIGASSLTLFTGKGGVIDDGGSLIEVINQYAIEDVRELVASRVRASSKGRGNGKGGFGSKLEAAWAAAEAGIPTKIAAVNNEMTGERVTRFVVV